MFKVQQPMQMSKLMSLIGMVMVEAKAASSAIQQPMLSIINHQVLLMAWMMQHFPTTTGITIVHQ